MRRFRGVGFVGLGLVAAFVVLNCSEDATVDGAGAAAGTGASSGAGAGSGVGASSGSANGGATAAGGSSGSFTAGAGGTTATV
jgi:hypothetical protein